MNERKPDAPNLSLRSRETLRSAGRALLVAMVAVVLWSVGNPLGWQIPAGIDVVRGAVPAPLLSALWRAAAVVFVGVTLFDRRASNRVGSLGAKAIATDLGLFALAIFVLGLVLNSSTLTAPLALAASMVLGYRLLQSAHAEPEGEPESPPPLSDFPITPAMSIGLFLGGLGLAVALQGLDARVALWGYGDPAEGVLRGVIFLAIAAFGAFAFSGLLSNPVARRLALTCAPLYITTACLVSLSLLTPLTGHDGLDAFLRSFDADLSTIGSPKGVALIAARGLFLPALAVGILLAATGRKAALLPLLLGTALGIAALPILPVDLHLNGSHEAPYARGMELCMVGTIACLAGWLSMAFAATPEPALRKRYMPLLLIAPLLGVPLGYDAPSVRPFSPWLSFEAEPTFIEDTPLGLLTVEPTVQGADVLTLNRIYMTPDAAFEQSDQLQLRASLDLLSKTAALSNRTIRVLLAGQITTGRWETFLTWQAEQSFQSDLSWTVPWERSVNQVRPFFEFAGKLKPPISQRDARQGIDRGTFDLVVTLATYGPGITALTAEDPPLSPGLIAGGADAGGNTTSIVWMYTRTPIAPAALEGNVLLAGSDLEHMAIGIATGPLSMAPGAETFALLAPNGSSHSGFARLQTRPELRAFGDRAELFARLSRQGSAAYDPAFLAGLADLLALQIESSPWTEPDVRYELDREILENLQEATKVPPSGFERTVWNHLARILSAKRMPEESYVICPLLLDKSPGGWPEIEYALARAYLEFLMPKDAAELLSPLYEADHLNLIPLLEYAACEGQMGNWPKAAEVLTRAFARAPDTNSIERHLAIAEMQAGLATGPARIKSALARDPEGEHNPELEAYLQSGPLPAPPQSFNPALLGERDDH